MIIKERSVEISIIALIFLAGVIFFGFKPLIKNLYTANLDTKVKKQELAKKQEKLDNLNTMKTKINSLRDSLVLMQKALPKSEDVPGILVSVEALAAQSGLKLSSFTPSAQQVATTAAPSTEETGEAKGAVPKTVTQQTGIASSTLGIGLSGDYRAFLTFLENVEKNIRPSSISQVIITGAGAKDKPITAALNMLMFYQK